MALSRDPRRAALRHRRPDRVPACRAGRRCGAFDSSRTCCSTPWVVCSTLIRAARCCCGSTSSTSSRAITTRRSSRCRCISRIGVCQCFAMIPGVSRSGATIVSAMLFGADKRSAAEFSFFLAMPTMAGAFTLDLFKNYDQMTANNASSWRSASPRRSSPAVFVVKTPARLRVAPRFCAVRVVARDRRHRPRLLMLALRDVGA